MKLTEVIADFERFGFPEEHVRAALAGGDSAFNAYEGLKSALTLRWGDLCQELSAARCAELRPAYDRLMGLRMTARSTRGDFLKRERGRVSAAADRITGSAVASRVFNADAFVEATREQVRKHKRAGTLGAQGEANARAIGLFAPDEEI